MFFKKGEQKISMDETKQMSLKSGENADFRRDTVPTITGSKGMLG